jgi:hypothetical protein
MGYLRPNQRKGNITFLEFFSVWAVHKQWDIPAMHTHIIEWLETRQDRNAVLQVFRGGSKSTIVGCYIAWKLLKNPEWRFLVLSADDTTAWKMSSDAQHIIDTHPLCRGMSGNKVWQATRWSVNGNGDPRNASVSSHGVMANITSSRADEVIFDDVEVPRNVRTETMRHELRQRIDETTHILVPGGKKLFVGTPHHFVSIYPEQIAKGAASLTIPLYDENGVNAWPERFTEEEIAYRRKECVTEGTWKSQYLLQPVPPSDIRLDPGELIPYTKDVVINSANGAVSMWIGDEQVVSMSCYWDVSLGKVKGDDSVLTILLSDAGGRLYIEHAEALLGGIDKQCERIKELAKKYLIPGVCVETNGPGGFVPAILRKHLSGMRCGVTQQHQTSRKAERILDAIEPALSGGFLYVNQKVLSQTPLSNQLMTWGPEASKHVKDDYIDSLAGAINTTPIRIRGNGTPSEWQDWRPIGGTNEVSLDYGWG